jgi:hypothetical protein
VGGVIFALGALAWTTFVVWLTRRHTCSRCIELDAERRTARAMLGHPEFRITRTIDTDGDLLAHIEQLGGAAYTCFPDADVGEKYWRDAVTGARPADEQVVAHWDAYIAWRRARQFLPWWRRPR